MTGSRSGAFGSMASCCTEPKESHGQSDGTCRKLAPLRGFEPPTNCLGNNCSIQLSYRGAAILPSRSLTRKPPYVRFSLLIPLVAKHPEERVPQSPMNNSLLAKLAIGAWIIINNTPEDNEHFLDGISPLSFLENFCGLIVPASRGLHKFSFIKIW